MTEIDLIKAYSVLDSIPVRGVYHECMHEVSRYALCRWTITAWWEAQNPGSHDEDEEQTPPDAVGLREDAWSLLKCNSLLSTPSRCLCFWHIRHHRSEKTWRTLTLTVFSFVVDLTSLLLRYSFKCVLSVSGPGLRFSLWCELCTVELISVVFYLCMIVAMLDFSWSVHALFNL